MREPNSTREKLQAVHANIVADAIVRAVQWVAFVAIVAGIAGPLAWSALRAHGIAAALAVLGLCVALAWGVKPAGRSLAAQARDVDARFPRE